MRVMELKKNFGLENLVPAEREEPAPGPGEVAVRLRAASLNYRDLMMVTGAYNHRQPLPLVPCSDGAGEVIAVGDGVTEHAVGDRVATSFFQRWTSGEATPAKAASTLGGPLDGTLREVMVGPEGGFVPLPEHLSHEEGATLPCAGVTAWNALAGLGSVKAGDTVLIQGTGGVALFATQFAKALGAKVIITSSSNEKLERAKTLGADEGINYRTTEDWGKEVLKRTGKRGVDHVIELGGAGTLAQSLTAVRMGGEISLIGVLSGVSQEINIIPILMRGIRVQGIFVGPQETFREMNRAIALHGLKPVIDSTFPLEDAVSALRHMQSGQHFGKIVISIG